MVVVLVAAVTVAGGAAIEVEVVVAPATVAVTVVIEGGVAVAAVVAAVNVARMGVDGVAVAHEVGGEGLYDQLRHTHAHSHLHPYAWNVQSKELATRTHHTELCYLRPVCVGFRSVHTW